MKCKKAMDGKWVKGHEVLYVEAADAEVIFK